MAARWALMREPFKLKGSWSVKTSLLPRARAVEYTTVPLSRIRLLTLSSRASWLRDQKRLSHPIVRPLRFSHIDYLPHNLCPQSKATHAYNKVYLKYSRHLRSSPQTNYHQGSNAVQVLTNSYRSKNLLVKQERPRIIVHSRLSHYKVMVMEIRSASKSLSYNIIRMLTLRLRVISWTRRSCILSSKLSSRQTLVQTKMW